MNDVQNTHSEQIMNEPYYSIDEVIEWDHLLYQLASYEVNKGMLSIPTSPQEVIQTAKRIAYTFNYFKRLIQNGECTFEYIYNTVLLRNGPFSQHPQDNPVNSPLVMPSKEQQQKHIEEFSKAVASSFGIIDPPPIGNTDEENETRTEEKTQTDGNRSSSKPIRKKMGKGKRSSK